MKHSLLSLWARLATPTPRGQRGIALLLTLGVLSLLLVLAMSFAYSTRTERAAAGNNADLVKARLLAESGMERAMALLRFASTATSSPVAISTEAALYPGTNSTFFYSPTSGNWSGRRYMFSINSTDQANIAAGLAVEFTPTSGTALTFTPSDNTLPNSGWIDILDSSSTSASPPIIGRVSYVVIDQGGMIDPNAVVSTGTSETTVVPRTGADPTEIQLNNLANPANGMANGFLTNTPTGMRWFSMAHIANKNTGSQAQFDIFRQALFPWSYDTDSYRLTPTSTDERSRYNLSNTGSATVADLTSTSTGVNGIPWLSDLRAENDTVNADDGTNIPNQVAANLKDYCDADDVATSDFTAIGNSVTYVGLEEVPYINEVTFTAALTTTGTPAYSELTLTAYCESVNIYNASHDASIQLQVEYTASGGGWTGGSPTLLQATALKPIPAHNYVDMGSLSVTASCSPAVSSDVSLTITKVSMVESNTAGVYTKDTLLDYSMLETDSPLLSISSGTTTSISVQVKDPRCNSSYANNWEWGAWGLTAGTMEAVNSNADASGKDGASPAGDLETVADPAGSAAASLSTAYIRNAPMQSLWELGAIHRGEAWRTLNLSKYNTTATGTNGTGGKYTDGDANILDQVKLSDATVTPIRGRFNANSPQTEAWACFLAGVTVGGTYNAPGTGAALDNVKGNSMASDPNGIFTINGADTSGSLPLTNRGGIAKWIDPNDPAKRSTLSNGSLATQTTDRAREEIIGKIAGLLTVRSNYFTVIVTAQSVKDTGAVDAKTSNTVQYAPSKYCQVLAEQKILAVVSRDAFTNKFVIESFEYLEE